MSFENKRPEEIQAFASDEQYSTGPYPGSPIKVKPPGGTFSSGFFPEQQFPAEWENFFDNHHTKMWAWLKEIQLRNWSKVGDLATASGMTRISGAVKNHYGDTILATNGTLGQYLLFGDFAPLVRPEEAGGNPAIQRIPDRYSIGVALFTPEKNGLVADSTGQYVVVIGENVVTAADAVVQIDFDKTVLGGRKGVPSVKTLTDFSTSQDNSISYDASLDVFLVVGVDATSGTDTHSWRSTDKGATWGAKVPLGGALTGLHMVAANNRGRFVSISRIGSDPEYAVSDDGGLSWVDQGTISGGFGQLSDLIWSEHYQRFFATTTYTAADHPSSVWESSDGIVWEMIADLRNQGGGASQGPETISDDPERIIVDGSMLVVVHSGRDALLANGRAPGMIISHDAGRTWIDVTMTINESTNLESPELGTVDDLSVAFDGSAFWALQLRNEAQGLPDAGIFRTIALGNNDDRAFSLAP